MNYILSYFALFQQVTSSEGKTVRFLYPVFYVNSFILLEFLIVAIAV